MAFDEKLAERVKAVLTGTREQSELRMMGGWGIMLRGNMCCGVHGDTLIVRVGPDATDAALREPHARPFDLTGKPMRGFVLIDPPGVRTDVALKAWLKRGVDFALTLPPKPLSGSRPRPRRTATRR